MSGTATKVRHAATRRSLRFGAAVLLATLVPLACGDATDVEILEIGGAGVLFGQAFLDFDGDGVIGGGDQPLADVEVILVTSTNAAVVQLARTDTSGIFTLFDVPVGSYRLSVDPAAVGDSLEVLGGGVPITIALGDTALVNLGVTYPTRTVEQIADEPVGRRVFTSGIALNPRLNFDPTGQVHFSGTTGYLRALNVERSALVTGDSVRLLGRVVSDNGRRALDDVTPNVLIPAAALVTPREVSVADAASADSAALDAALVRIRNAAITDTLTGVDGYFRFWALDGVDSVEVVVRDFLGLNTSVIRPDTIMELSQAIGLLTPVDDGSGTIRWQILPRAAGDVVLNPVRTANLAVSIAVDTADASLGDTVEVTVIVSNGGPNNAVFFEVRDTIPTALTYVSSSQTGGSYASDTGLWSIDKLVPGAADTLRVRMEVTDDTPATIPLVVEVIGLTQVVDPNAGNNSASTSLGVS
jgi:uncharacterized repeat protein (TIGR01451 family)